MGPCICVIRPMDLVLEPEPAVFESDNCLEVLNIYLSLFRLARLILVLRWIGTQSEPHQRRCVPPERERERERERDPHCFCQTRISHRQDVNEK